MRSLRRQLALGLGAGTALLLLALHLLLVGSVRSLAEEQARTRLQHDAESLLAALESGPDGPRLAEGAALPLYQRPFGGHYYVVRVAGRELRSRSLWDQTLPPLADGSAHLAGPRGQPLLAFSATYRRQEQPLQISVAEDLTSLESALDAFQWRYAGANALLLLALLALQQLVLRRALRPLEATRAELRRLELGEVTTLAGHGPAEIAPLVTAFNGVAGALQRRTERSQKALGNLAHALKGPLAVLAQLEHAPALRDQAELRATLAAEVERLRASIERELRRARVVGYAAPGQAVDLGATVADLQQTLARLYHERGLRFDVALPPAAAVAVDRHDLYELLGNLLDNACKWAVGAIRVRAEQGSGQLQLSIEDDGPGVPAERLGELQRRGQRLDEAVAGHGLGLAIAGDIVARYGGALEFGRAEGLGGLRASITLPRHQRGGSE
ncbi:MAG TPA: sensor histidine kinase [Gammaproteobacteria bacterium]